MSRVVVIVEGPTEESFVKGPLAEILWPHKVYLTPIILGVPGQKGGRTNYARVRKDLLRQLKQDATAYCSTMIDFYGLGPGFPGVPPPLHENAPSKRVIAIYSSYRKVIEGTLAARAVGIEKMRQECGHFRNWLEQLQSLPDL